MGLDTARLAEHAVLPSPCQLSAEDKPFCACHEK
jgi:hypothetical protein